jgi:murein DD-endopeptidase MepM/ murein hydrolase activator NlpD
MRRLISADTIPGLLTIGALVGILLLPLLWMARLGVRMLRERSTSATDTAPPPQTKASSPVAAAATPLAVAVPAPTPTAPDPPALRMPVRGAARRAIHDTFGERRGSRRHEGLDIHAPRGTVVLAAVAGRVARLSRSGAGGIEIYQMDSTGRFCMYYAHLLRYAGGLREGQDLTRGQTVGYVGSSGNAPDHAPHLHFAVYRAEAPDRCHGEPLNPLPLLR